MEEIPISFLSIQGNHVDILVGYEADCIENRRMQVKNISNRKAKVDKDWTRNETVDEGVGDHGLAVVTHYSERQIRKMRDIHNKYNDG